MSASILDADKIYLRVKHIQNDVIQNDVIQNNVIQNNVIQNMRDSINDLQSNLDIMLSQYRANYSSSIRVNELHDDLTQHNKELQKQVDLSRKNILTDGRKVYYEIEQIDNLKLYRTLMIYFFYILLFFYLLYILFKRSTSNKFKINLITIIFLGIFAAIPFIVKNIIDFIYSYL